MNFAIVLAGLLANYFIFVDTISESEPQCYSRFDYEFKVVEKLFTLETAHKKQQEINQELKDALEETKNENKALNRKIEALKNVSIQKEGKVVAFSAYLDHTLSNLQKNQVIVFNRILLNEGEGYDTTSGVFTCPRTGVYLATFFVGIRGTIQCWASLVINDNRKIEAVVEAKHDHQDLQGGNSVIVKLDKGDKMWIKQRQCNELKAYTGLKVSTFSGVLLYPVL